MTNIGDEFFFKKYKNVSIKKKIPETEPIFLAVLKHFANIYCHFGILIKSYGCRLLEISQDFKYFPSFQNC